MKISRGLSLRLSLEARRADAYLRYPYSIKRLEVFLLPLDGMLVHRRVTPSIEIESTDLYTWVGSVTVRVKCLP